MYQITIPNLFSVSAPDEKGLEKMISRAIALRDEHAETLKAATPSAPRLARPANVPHDYAMQWAEKHGKRFRLTLEEEAEHGKEGRQEAAKARLLAEGETLEGATGSGAEMGATVDGAKLDESLASEFEP